MSASKILVPIGFSDQSIVALGQAFNLARIKKSDIVLLSVIKEQSVMQALFTDDKSDDLIPDRFIEVKGTTGKNFSIFWSQNEIEAAQELGVKYWIYFVREIDVENETAPNEPEMIPNAFYEIDPFDNDPDNKEFVKKSESIHVTKRQEN